MELIRIYFLITLFGANLVILFALWLSHTTFNKIYFFIPEKIRRGER